MRVRYCHLGPGTVLGLGWVTARDHSDVLLPYFGEEGTGVWKGCPMSHGW